MTTEDTLYDVLGVPITADDEEIQQAYRRLSLQVHSDVGGTDVLFRLVRTAYEVLSDPEKRQRYDDAMGLVRPYGSKIAVDEVVDRLSSLLASGGGITVGYAERPTPLRIIRVIRRGEMTKVLTPERRAKVSDAMSIALDGGEGYLVAEVATEEGPAFMLWAVIASRVLPLSAVYAEAVLSAHAQMTFDHDYPTVDAVEVTASEWET